MRLHCRGLNVRISKGYYSRVSVKLLLLLLLLLLEGGNSSFCFDDVFINYYYYYSFYMNNMPSIVSFKYCDTQQY